MSTLLRTTKCFAVLLGVLLTLAVSTSGDAQELIGYWQFEETNFDDPAVDSSGSGNDGVYEGTMDPNVEGAPGFGSGAYFDGFSSIYIGPGDETGYGDLTSDFSVMAWIKPDQLTVKNRIFGSSPWEANSGWGWGTIRDELEITTWGVRDYDQPVPLELDEWAHVAVVLDDTFAAHFYHNGEFIGTQVHASEGGPTVNDFYIGQATVAEFFSGFMDEVAVFQGALSDEQIVNAMTLGVANFNGNADPLAPLDDGTLTDPQERADYVHNVLKTWVGDSNLDGLFNSQDFVTVFLAGEYEDAVDDNSSWVTGDWNGDKDFTSSDFVAAFLDGGYEVGPRPAAAAAAVPEPASLMLLAFGLVGLATRRWK